MEIDPVLNKILQGKKPLIADIPALENYLLSIENLRIENNLIKAKSLTVGQILPDKSKVNLFGIFKQILPENFGYRLLKKIEPQSPIDPSLLNEPSNDLKVKKNMSKDIKIHQSIDELKTLSKLLDPIREQAKNNQELGFEDKFGSFLLLMSFLNPQSYGTRIQNRIGLALGGKTVPSQSNKGDILVKDSYYEIKLSFITKTNCALNLVQVRLWQNVNYLCFWFNTDTFEYSLYELTHEQMEEEMKLVGASSAHGTKSVNEKNENVELRYSLNIDANDPHFQRWEKNYKSSKLDHLF